MKNDRIAGHNPVTIVTTTLRYIVMTMSLTSPVTGSAQTGLTSPTYTLVSDVAPDANGRQWAVSALGGTQTGVAVSSISSPFTCSLFRPKVFKILGSAVNGVVKPNGTNQWKVITRKGVTPASGVAPVVANLRTTLDIPAGSDSFDMASLRAALSLHIGALTQLSAGIGDSVTTGIF